VEQLVSYELETDSIELSKAIEARDNGRDADTEMVLACVPEAGEMCFADALRLAHERDEAAAEALALDFQVQVATL